MGLRVRKTWVFRGMVCRFGCPFAPRSSFENCADDG